MKTVFSNYELAHVWASQSQETGRNSKNSMYFNGNTIYSYGSHYAMGAIYNNCSVVLLNEYSYSSSTAQQRSKCSSATSHMLSFYVPDVTDPKAKENLEYLNTNIVNSFNSLLKEIRPYSRWADKSERPYSLTSFLELIEDYNKYCEAFQIKDTIKLEENFLELLEEISTYNVNRQLEREARYNTPEEIAKREKAAARKIELENKKTELVRFKALIKIKEWKQNKIFGSYSFNLPAGLPVFLKIKDDKLYTSKGASVKLEEALKLLYLVDKNTEVKGHVVGSYEVSHRYNGNIVIGCHDITLKESYRTLGHLLNIYKVFKLNPELGNSPNSVAEIAIGRFELDLTSAEVVAISNAL